MIVDELKNSSDYDGLGVRLKEGLEWLRKNRLRLKKIGRYKIVGDDIFAIVKEYQTMTNRKNIWEAHKKYYDIHFVLNGIEKIGWAPTKNLQNFKKYDPTADSIMLKGKGDLITLRRGQFAIFFPNDAHIPGIIDRKISKVRKVVLKVKK